MSAEDPRTFRPSQEAEEQFVADRMLGKLARWLRVLGYDTLYLGGAEDEMIRRGLQEGRVFLTRNRRAHPWLKRGRVMVIKADDPREQLREVVRRLHLPLAAEALLHRCLGCNRPLVTVDKEEVRGEVPDYVWQTHVEFRRCQGCRRVFWAGSHAEKMRHRLKADFSDLWE
jgi:uncharacterized protein with PIN domain